MSNLANIPPSTPPRPSKQLSVITPQTPQDDYHITSPLSSTTATNTTPFSPPMKLKKNTFLSVPPSITKNTAKTPKTQRKVYSGVGSLITPDYTPKLKKRQDMYNSLVASMKSEQESECGGSLQKKQSILEQLESHAESQYETEEEEEEEEEEERSIVEPQTPTGPREIAQLPTDDFLTPIAKVLKTQTSLGDDFEEDNDLSSPSIRKQKGRRSLGIFQSRELRSFPPAVKTHEYKKINFNPNAEILLINKKGDHKVKKFDTSNRFDRDFQPKWLLGKLLSVENGEDKLEQVDDKAKKDDELVARLLEEYEEDGKNQECDEEEEEEKEEEEEEEEEEQGEYNDKEELMRFERSFYSRESFVV
ncbi:hypothetical protein DASC09_045810 [Saccharomycopsis crataegensis]|uniref:Uncharacterized protein n=1 Tax=Saccharomycopsis crataegensis TaxID=43959 RepID=A0AAV5QR90_9ASCO|nr:hypothetical protein DASC09_045810 [Saccharomycopsis crataegensis]